MFGEGIIRVIVYPTTNYRFLKEGSPEFGSWFFSI